VYLVSEKASSAKTGGCAGMTPYQVRYDLQIVLAVILGPGPLCCLPVTSTDSLPPSLECNKYCWAPDQNWTICVQLPRRRPEPAGAHGRRSGRIVGSARRYFL
jgi:hypothetical protein